ncbi:MAG TPA: MFS transporter [Ktedonobacterales bacterium]|nr:MFS transporter [Ktedonobacterales bacterium]
MTPDGVAEKPKTARLWSNRDWALLWSGQLVSVVGTQVSQLAYPLLMLALTNSPAQAGFLSAARTIPYFVLGLPAGALVDRWNRKRVMLVCDAGRALALGSIPLALALQRLTLTHLYIVALVDGALNVFFNLAETAALTRVVSREQIPSATALNELTLSTGSMLGPALGGLVFAIGQGFAFLADAISYAISVVSVWFIRTELSAPRTAETRRLLDDIREGVMWLWRQSLLRFLAFVVGGVVLIESGYMLVVIILAQHMGASPAEIGLVLGAGGVGSFVGALLSGPAMRRLTLGQIALGVHWIWALLLPLFVIAPNPLALAALMLVTYGITPVFFVAQYSYRLARIPDELQGRVNSVVRLPLFVGQPLGLALAGLLSQTIGPVNAILVFSALLLALALAITLNRELRRANLTPGPHPQPLS